MNKTSETNGINKMNELKEVKAVQKELKTTNYNKESVQLINRYVRGYLSRLQSKGEMQKLTQRKNVVMELYNTEMIYVNKLTTFQ